jgi:asparagine synthetase B (glutamine-hydrolysing)
MCGIVGIVDSNGRPVDESALQNMCDAIIHRGPDERVTMSIGALKQALGALFTVHPRSVSVIVAAFDYRSFSRQAADS